METLQSWMMVFAGPLLTLVVLGVWRYRDTTTEEIQKVDKRVSALEAKVDAKFDALNKFLTDNLMLLNREMGELKGASHRHVPNE